MATYLNPARVRVSYLDKDGKELFFLELDAPFNRGSILTVSANPAFDVSL